MQLKKQAGQMNWPHERELKGGMKGYKIYGSYCPPALAWIIDVAMLWCFFAGLAYLLYSAALTYENGAYNYGNKYDYLWKPAIGLLFMMIASRNGMFRWLATIILGAKIHLLVTKGNFYIGKWYGYKKLPLAAADFELAVETIQRQQFTELIRVPDYQRVYVRFGEQKITLASITGSPEKSDALAKRINIRLNELNIGGTR